MVARKTPPPFSRNVDENHSQRSLALFNAARFFDAHEALEDAWREVSRQSPLRRHLQGLVQLAVAFHHQSTGNCVGALSVLKRGLRNLEGAEESLPELDLVKLRSCLEAWLEYLETPSKAADSGDASPSVRSLDATRTHVPMPRLPQITLRRELPR